MEWQKDIWFLGKQVQQFRYQDVCPIKVVQSAEDKICCINSQQKLRMFNLENLQIEKEISLKEKMAENLFRFYKPIHLSEQYIYNQGYILNIKTEQSYYIEYDYTLDYVDEQNIYGYKIIRNKDFELCLQVVEFDHFGQIMQKIYEQNNFINECFLIDKCFIIVQQQNQGFKFFLIKKQKKLTFRIKQSNLKFQILSLKNNQLMFINIGSHHAIKLLSQLKIIRRTSQLPNFIAIIGSLCIGIEICKNDKSQTKLFYYDYISFQQGEIDAAFGNGNTTCVGNSKYFSFTLNDQLHVLKFKP